MLQLKDVTNAERSLRRRIIGTFCLIVASIKLLSPKYYNYNKFSRQGILFMDLGRFLRGPAELSERLCSTRCLSSFTRTSTFFPQDFRVCLLSYSLHSQVYNAVIGHSQFPSLGLYCHLSIIYNNSVRRVNYQNI